MNVTEAFNSGSMTSMVGDHALRIGLSRLTSDHTSNLRPMTLLPANSANISDRSLAIKHNRAESLISTMNKLVKGKLGLGVRILQIGGVDKLFRRIFTVGEHEQLFMASRCCLYTTAGPIPGRLFISSDKIAFCSYREIATASVPSGETLRFHYKIVIPITKIQAAMESENVKKPKQKYVQVVTTDEFEFWFTGFLHYKKTFKCLQQVVSQSSNF